MRGSALTSPEYAIKIYSSTTLHAPEAMIFSDLDICTLPPPDCHIAIILILIVLSTMTWQAHEEGGVLGLETLPFSKLNKPLSTIVNNNIVVNKTKCI